MSVTRINIPINQQIKQHANMPHKLTFIYGNGSVPGYCSKQK